MINESLETPATVVIVPNRRNSGRARVVKSGLTLAGAVRFVAERMAPVERPRAVIRTPTRSLLIDEITALYRRADFRSAPAEADCERRAPAEEIRLGSGAPEQPEAQTEDSGHAPVAVPRSALQRTAIRFGAAGIVALGLVGAAGLVADYCRNDAGPTPAKIVLAVHRTDGAPSDEPRARTADPGPPEPASDREPDTLGEGGSGPSVATSPVRDLAEAIPAAGAPKPDPSKRAGRTPGPVVPKAVRRHAALSKAVPTRRSRKLANSYPSMRIGARYVMRDPILLAGGRYN